ncbi:phage tail tape measure protein [Streptomyces sp. IpFD-1.1]|uniref:phage tail tape measure protein n=1 Tax=Streptomyces sp. IpFD-1.1 TaxID=2841664 RepID=UPI002095D37A|nr:phage tail tape measure protein [Streptomyces sp. IpFD-1.1]MCO6747870.1 phage tail tape measure protein [Streptomyces sp. IpFD-1.1]
MALTVGELLATIAVDETGVGRGLDRAERNVRSSGSMMAADADRAGRQAGTALGGGLATTAASSVRRAGGDIADAGGDVGEATGTSLRDRMSSSLQVGLAGVGVAAGALLAHGFGQALEQGQIAGRLGAQLGATPAEAKKYGEIAGSMYADAVTTDFQGAADAISATMRAGIAPPDATNAQIQSIATKVSDLATTFELDLGQTANAVGQMLKTGLAKNGTEALDILTKGLQNMGPRADDIADTFNEYSTIFRNLGIDATTATGLMSQGLKAGARDTDVVADSLKEFLLTVQGGGPEVDEAFKSIGLNGKEMQAAFAEGGPKASAALDKVFDAMRKIKDPTEQNSLALALFKTKSEDMQKALFSLDPSKAVDTLGKVGGAADEMGNSLRDNAGAKIEAFKRGAMQTLTDFIGNNVIPALASMFGFVQEHKEVFTALAAIIAAVVLPVIIALGVQSLIAGGQMAAAWITAMGPIGWVGLAIGALVVLIVTYWDEIKEWTGAAWKWVTDKLLWAKDKAISLFTNFALVGLIAKHWSTIKSNAVEWLTGVVDWVRGVPGKLYNAFLNWQLTQLIVRYWNDFKSATSRKAGETVNWVRGLPGRLASAIGNLGSLLVNKGKDVVRGLWSGIKSMGAWLKNTLIGWAKDLIPGPIAKALGIASPSRVMANRVGRWIPAGVVKGIRSGQGALDRAMSTLVTPPDVPAVAGIPSAGFGATPSGVHIEHWHAAENGSPDDNARALNWLAKARG